MVYAPATDEPVTGVLQDLPWDLARERAHAAAPPLEAVEVALGDAAGASLARGLVATAPLPGFDTAAMDGFAVTGSGPWRVVGESVPGRPWAARRLEDGAAIRIATGAVVPRGARAVLPIEQAVTNTGELDGPELPEGRHIRRTGEDARAGTELAAAGTRVGPALIGLAATCGYDTLRVHRRPVVRVIVTGDELVHAGAAAPGRVRDALGPLLRPFLAEAGAEVDAVVHALDSPATALGDAVAAASGAEVVVVAGSTSVGTTDGLRPLLAAQGAELIVDTVACRPGHPQLLARLDGGPYVVGLPGNPFAALVAAYTLLVPLLDGLAGRPLRRLPQAMLAEPVQAPPGKTRIVPVVWEGSVVRPLGGSRPAFLNGAALGDALAVVPPGTVPGTPVPVIAL
ncbi:molybdopterin molybdotransferase MoeA [Glycomyces sp. NRRL B-16210]|uniref:molybdopterin molybdotransferase MoeA n=1 Tax=Glycomyces sp. NRRL B-16210 TaxID=1463821 RepID=UPI00068D3C1C|nr:molybdopterin molybdotransferase MoeA [Glycomyces sp. NRRL B-16210]